MTSKRPVHVNELVKMIGNKTPTRIYQVINKILEEGEDKDYYRTGRTIVLNPEGVKSIKDYFKKNGKQSTSAEHTK